MIYKFQSVAEILTNEFSRRQNHNPKYSMRAYARDLNLGPSRLSEILQGKQGLSQKKAVELAKSLNLSKLENDYFITLVESQFSRSKAGREAAKTRLKKFNFMTEVKQSLEVFEAISKWEHLAILELLLLKKNKITTKWIATHLDISEVQVKEAINRLLGLGLVEKSGNILKRVSDEYFVWPTEIPSLSIKNYHKDVLKKSIEKLFTVDLEEREFNSVVMPINPDKIPEAKKLMKKFNRDMAKLLSDKKKNSRIYYFSSQLFPADTGPLK